LSLDATDEAAARLAERENGAFGRAPAAGAPATLDPVVAILGNLLANEHLKESDAFARMAHAALLDGAQHAGRGVKQAPFVVLVGLQMPASLVEIGFITHAGEEGRLGSGEGRARIARELSGAVLDYGKRHDAMRGVALPKRSGDGGRSPGLAATASGPTSCGPRGPCPASPGPRPPPGPAGWGARPGPCRGA